MANKEDYAKWCAQLIQGEDHMIDDIYAALIEDGYVNDDLDLDTMFEEE
jgi:hypothetical protein